jgi:hypothetical protein
MSKGSNAAQLSTARQLALLYGWPGGSTTGDPRNAKTGTFSGYFRDGHLAWRGRFDVGIQVGLWEYYIYPKKNSEPEIINEFYCNL